MLSGFANLGAAVAYACESDNLRLDSEVGATSAGSRKKCWQTLISKTVVCWCVSRATGSETIARSMAVDHPLPGGNCHTLFNKPFPVRTGCAVLGGRSLLHDLPDGLLIK